METKINKNDWHFYVPLTLGILILLSTLIFVILNGGQWFKYDPDPTNPKPAEDLYRVFGGAYTLAYFTNQTNLFVGVTLILIAFVRTQKSYSWFFASNALITITFLLYWTLLAPFKSDQSEWSNSPFFLFSTLFTHGINPLIGFIYMILIRNELIIDKKIVGIAALYVSLYYVFSIIFYGIGGQNIINAEGKPEFQGGIIYGFLNPKKLFFIPLENLPVLAIFLNLLVFFIAPFLAILFSLIWIAALKIKTTENSYYKWVFKLKNKFNKKDKIKNQSSES